MSFPALATTLTLKIRQEVVLTVGYFVNLQTFQTGTRMQLVFALFPISLHSSLDHLQTDQQFFKQVRKRLHISRPAVVI